MTYDRRIAERFGLDARIRIFCAADLQGDPELRDRHVPAVYDDARLAFHFAELVRSQQLEAPHHSSGPPRPASAPQIAADSG